MEYKIIRNRTMNASYLDHLIDNEEALCLCDTLKVERKQEAKDFTRNTRNKCIPA